MSLRGVGYNASYGLSIEHIRKECLRMGRCNALAMKLWEENTRETRLFGLYLMEPAKCDSEFAERITRQIDTLELSQHAAYAVFAESQIDEKTILAWCADTSTTVKMTGYNTLIRKIKNDTFASVEFGTLFDIVLADIRNDRLMFTQVFISLLDCIARVNQNLIPESFAMALEVEK